MRIAPTPQPAHDDVSMTSQTCHSTPTETPSPTSSLAPKAPEVSPDLKGFKVLGVSKAPKAFKALRASVDFKVSSALKVTPDQRESSI